jgi:hypothetical protein
MLMSLAVTQKSYFGSQLLYLVNQVKDGFDPGQFEAVNGMQVLDASQGIDGLLREFQDPIGRLNHGLYQAGAAIDQNGPAGYACDTGRCLEAV